MQPIGREPSSWQHAQYIDTTVRLSEHICMELTVAEAARRHGFTPRFLQQALRSGTLQGLRQIGRVSLLDDLAVQAWQRSLSRGRRWSRQVRQAALDLLSTGRTNRLSSSEKARLRARLRTMDAAALAHASGGVGADWGRYRFQGDPRGLALVGPSQVDTSLLGIATGNSWVTFAQVEDLDRLELEHDAILDADGNLVLLQRPEVDNRVPRVLLDSYLLGDSRLSAAAGSQLERLCREF